MTLAQMLQHRLPGNLQGPKPQDFQQKARSGESRPLARLTSLCTYTCIQLDAALRQALPNDGGVAPNGTEGFAQTSSDCSWGGAPQHSMGLHRTHDQALVGEHSGDRGPHQLGSVNQDGRQDIDGQVDRQSPGIGLGQKAEQVAVAAVPRVQEAAGSPGGGCCGL